MIYDRWEAGCALFNSGLHGNRPVVLAVGGGSATAEIFDYTIANNWEQSEQKFDLTLLIMGQKRAKHLEFSFSSTQNKEIIKISHWF